MLAVGHGLWGVGIEVREEGQQEQTEYWPWALGCELIDVGCGHWGKSGGATGTDRILAMGCRLWAVRCEMGWGCGMRALG